MCGIVGVVDFLGRPVSEALIGRMCEQIRHRGPDDRGILCLPGYAEADPPQPSIGLGNQRLSIIDLQGGHQPISNEDRTVWTVLNGEIYNFQTLREELTQRGHRFSTQCDTEVIVHLYEEHGEAFVSQLDGMFALAIWDARRQRLLLARDRFGKKPLLYANMGGRFTFASEFSALLCDPAIPRDLDLDALDAYLTYMSIPAPWTIYRAVRKLPPAHLLVVDRSGLMMRPYWQLAFTPKLALSEGEAAERLLELLTEAVRKRLISDVPLGAFLSGGVDSSAVVALMTRLSAGRVKTFSIGFEETGYNELPHARRVAQALGCEHHEFIVRPRAVEILPILIRHFGEPFADSSAIPTYYLAKLTRAHVTVALNGDGGDEVFGGYDRHLAHRLAEQWQRVPQLLRRSVRWMSGPLNGRARDPRSWSGRLWRFLDGIELTRVERYRQWVGVISPDLKRSLMPSSDGIYAEAARLVDRLFGDREELDAVDASLAVDTAFYLPTDLLVKMDVMSMANSLEARSPFLDHHLVEFAARLPSQLKIHRFVTKYILKRAASPLIPRENLTRAKRGFAVPIGHWFRTELRELLADHLLSSRVAQDGLLAQAAITRLLEAHLSGRAEYAHQLWTLLMLELWYRGQGSHESLYVSGKDWYDKKIVSASPSLHTRPRDSSADTLRQ